MKTSIYKILLTEIETFKRLNKRISDHYLSSLKTIVGVQKRVEYCLETEDFSGMEHWNESEFCESLAKANDHLTKLLEALKIKEN